MADTLSTSGVLGAANQTVTLGVAGLGGVAFQIQGSFTGTVTFEASVQGHDFTAFRVVPANSSTAVSTATAPGLWSGSCVGYLVVRARMSAYTNGAATVLIRADVASPGGGGGGGGVGSDVNLIEVGGASIALGETTMAASLPVVIASDQTPVPITGSISADNPSVGPTGDPVPAEATLVGVADPSGDLEALSAETFDYDTGAGTVPVTAFGIALPGSGGPVAGGTNTNPVQVGDAGASLTVDGTVTAAQATAANLNATVVGTGTFGVQVSASALPSGAATLAEQQSQTTALQIIDDWDESDRAKVNPIVGSAGITGGAGAVDAATTRVAIATNANAVTAVGTVADDSPTPGNPITVGGLAKAPDGTDPGAVSEDDVARIITDLNRRVYVNVEHPQWWSFHSDGSSALTDQTVQADPGDGFQIVITNIVFSTGAATACNIFFEEGASKILGPWYLEAVAGRGIVWVGAKKVTASTALTVTTSAAIAQSLDVQGYIQKVP